jgi:CubicO group peptidase (beta-lactamase class C family)
MQHQRRTVAAVVLATGLAATGLVSSAGPDQQLTVAVSPASVDELFSRWTTSTPGCAVGVSDDGRVVLERAYGMANLDHAVPNQPHTIFEAGSVSKQFTAAAVLLLAQDGLISLDDPVRRHVPELPDFGWPLTIRHLLTHTSGLRDWGSLASIAGWPRASRVHTHAHVLDILARQTALNFEPGTRWSYSNSGYNLSAVIVSRVTGMSFAEYSRTRVFEPAGMTNTSWRDDFRRIVPNRATAYSGGQSGYRENMPFENVHGNGGLLTTVVDLLRWNENFVSADVGGAEFVARMQQPAHLNDGRDLHYAMGLFVGTYRGRREIYHSGSTAGYRAYLTRFPDDHVTVAVLCNAANANAAQLARAVVDLYLPTPAEPGLPPSRRLPEAAGPLSGLGVDPNFTPDADALGEFKRRDPVASALGRSVSGRQGHRSGHVPAHRRPGDGLHRDPRPRLESSFRPGHGELRMLLPIIRIVLLLAPVVFAVRMLTAWSRLPASMATHFSGGGDPDSYLPRVAFLIIGIAALTFTSVLFIRREGDPYGQAIAAGITVAVSVAFWQVVTFNLGDGQIAIMPALLSGAVAAAVVAVLALRTPPRQSS